MLRCFSHVFGRCLAQDADPDSSMVSEATAGVVESQPLRADEELWRTGRLVNQSRAKKRPSWLPCCSKHKAWANDDRVDLCPSSWFQVCRSCNRSLIDEQDPPPGCLQMCSGFCWKILFVICCLPVCYPCYLSRTLRRRRKVWQKGRSLHEDGLVSRGCNDLLNGTLTYNVSLTRPRCQNEGDSSIMADDQLNPTLQNVIHANVILVQSDCSHLLHQFLRTGPDHVDGGEDSTAGSLSQPTVADESKQPRVGFVPHLSAVLEEAAAADEQVQPGASLSSPQSQCAKEPSKMSRGSSNRWSRLSVFRRSAASISQPEPFMLANETADSHESPVTMRKKLSDATSYVRDSSSIYHSLDGEGSERNDDRDSKDQASLVEMKSLGQRTEIVRDLGYQLSFAIFDEASVAEWTACDFSQTNHLPDIDLVIIVVRKGQTHHIRNMLDLETGIMSYLCTFWPGFYALLLIELSCRSAATVQDSETAAFQREIRRLCSYFRDCHHIQMEEEDLEDQLDWVDECMARLFIHFRLYQCSRFHGDGVNTMERCPGGCGLTKHKEKRHRLTRKKAQRRLTTVYRRSRPSHLGPSSLDQQ